MSLTAAEWRRFRQRQYRFREYDAMPQVQRDLRSGVKAMLTETGGASNLSATPASVAKWMQDQLWRGKGFENLTNFLTETMETEQFSKLTSRQQQRIITFFLKIVEQAKDAELNIKLSVDQDISEEELNEQLAELAKRQAETTAIRKEDKPL